MIGWTFYGEHIDVFVFAGAGLIVAGVLWNLRAEAQRNLAATEPAGGAGRRVRSRPNSRTDADATNT